MSKRDRIFAASVVGVGFLATGAFAQSLTPQFPPRCHPEPLAAPSAGDDPCKPPIAVFGPSGPTVLASNSSDVETTGSLGSNRQPVRKLRREQ